MQPVGPPGGKGIVTRGESALCQAQEKPEGLRSRGKAPDIISRYRTRRIVVRVSLSSFQQVLARGKLDNSVPRGRGCKSEFVKN